MARDPSTERERWRRKRVVLTTLPLVGWAFVAGSLVVRSWNDPAAAAGGLGCIALMVVPALILGGVAVTVALYLSRNDPK